MNYLDKLRKSAKQTGSIACMGLDPIANAMPSIRPDYNYRILYFFEPIFKEMKSQGVLPGAFKSNQGFYVRHNRPRESRFDGSSSLAGVLDMLKEMFPEIPVILDYKRGDIAKSSANYAAEGFEAWQADAVTISPYMGTDSVGPFIEYGKGVYILDRTSNPGAKDFQNLKVIPEDVEIGKIIEARLKSYLEEPRAVPEEKVYSWLTASDEDNFMRKGMRNTIKSSVNELTIPLYEAVAHKIINWAQEKPGVGAVIGATSPEELSDLAKLYAGKDIPLLIPGVGGQGGKADEVVSRLKDAGCDLGLIRINSSSGITHPWAKKKQPVPEDYAKVCVEELRKLNESIGYKA